MLACWAVAVVSASAEELYLSTADPTFDFCGTDEFWSPKKVPARGDNCYNKTEGGAVAFLTTPTVWPTASETKFLFLGDSLTIAGNGYGSLVHAPSSIEFKDYGDNKGLVLGDGAVFRIRDSSAATNIIKGVVTVEASSSKKATLNSTLAAGSSQEVCLQVQARFVGAASACLAVSTFRTYTGPVAIELLGDASEYYGMVRTVAENDCPRIRTGCPVFAGTIFLAQHGRYETCAPSGAETAVSSLQTANAETEIFVRPGNTLKVSSMTLNGGEITVRSEGDLQGTLIVTDSLSVNGNVIFKAQVPDGSAATYEVLKVPTTFAPIDQLGMSFDTAEDTLTYSVVTNGDWQVLRATSRVAALTLSATDRLDVPDVSAEILSVVVGYDAAIRSAGCLTLSGRPQIKESLIVSVPSFSTLSNGDSLTGEQPCCPILKVAAGTVDREKIELDLQAKIYANGERSGYLPRSYSRWVDNEDGLGYDVLYIGYWPVVTRGRWEDAPTPNEIIAGSITNFHYWSDGKEPHPMADYLIPYVSSTDGGPYAAWLTDDLRDADNVYTFAGASLTLGYLIQLPSEQLTAEVKVNGPLTFLHANKSSFSGVAFGCGPVLDGVFTQTLTAEQVRLYPLDPFYLSDFYRYWPGFRGRNGYHCVVNAPLEGGDDSGCVFMGESGSYKDGPVFVLRHESPDFSGHITLHSIYSGYSPSAERPIRLCFSSPGMLGSSPSQFTTNALTLADWGYLRPTVPMTLDTPNRGILVRYHGGVTNDVALTLGSRITYAGEFEKQGSGVLTFACEDKPMTVDDYVPNRGAVSESSSVYVNLWAQVPQIRVSGGSICATTKNAIDGIKVLFDGGAIRVNPDAEEGSVERSYGLYNAASDDLLQAAEAGLKIPVEFDVSKHEFGDELAGTICTVRGTGLTSGSFKLVKPWGKLHKLTVTCTDNPDGTKTFRATAVPSGMLLLFR